MTIRQGHNLKRFRDRYPELNPRDIRAHDVDGALLRLIQEMENNKEASEVLAVLGSRNREHSDFVFLVRANLVLRIKEAFAACSDPNDVEPKTEISPGGETKNIRHVLTQCILMGDCLVDEEIGSIAVQDFNNVLVYLRSQLEKSLVVYEEKAQVSTVTKKKV